MNLIEDPFFQILIARLIQPGVIGLAITGSYSRNQNDPHSDVDVDIFAEALPADSYTLRIFDGKLVSLKYILLRDEYDSLTKPERAVWAVPGLRQLQILKDDSGELATLKQAALDFKWEPLQNAANEYAVEALMGCSEEARKIVGGLMGSDEAKVLYASWGMFKKLSFAAAVQAGLMIESENRIFDMLRDHFGRDHAWTRAFRLSFGMDVGNPSIPAFQIRGLASLDLYEQTHKLFESLITDERREVIEDALKVISSYKQGRSHA
ncbi:MAG: hypothetical protein HYZ23_03675 [Chloroflexi bacterium]|nr:hypothetical protein [Chloroflexota bacterium]